MKHLVVENDPSLRVAPAILDPATSEQHRRAVADFFAHDEPDFDEWAQRLRRRLPNLYPARIEFVDTQEELRAKIGAADAAIVESLKIGRRDLANVRKLRLVQKLGGLTGNIDLEACAKHGVSVTTLRRRVNIAVAEQAFALMLALARRVTEFNGRVGKNALEEAGHPITSFDRRYTVNSNYARIPGLKSLNGAILGALGLGEIGREVARRANAFGMRVVYSQRTRLSAAEEWELGGATYLPLDELLSMSDFVSIHLPLVPETEGLIGEAELARMKQGTILVNIARAKIVDRNALDAALASGHLGGFGLDPGYEEPARDDEPLLRHPNAILLPHTGPADRRNALEDWEEMLLKMNRALAVHSSVVHTAETV